MGEDEDEDEYGEMGGILNERLNIMSVLFLLSLHLALGLHFWWRCRNRDEKVKGGAGDGIAMRRCLS